MGLLSSAATQQDLRVKQVEATKAGGHDWVRQGLQLRQIGQSRGWVHIYMMSDKSDDMAWARPMILAVECPSCSDRCSTSTPVGPVRDRRRKKGGRKCIPSATSPKSYADKYRTTVSPGRLAGWRTIWELRAPQIGRLDFAVITKHNLYKVLRPTCIDINPAAGRSMACRTKCSPTPSRSTGAQPPIQRALGFFEVGSGVIPSVTPAYSVEQSDGFTVAAGETLTSIIRCNWRIPISQRRRS
jgi:hypothetical protein